MGICKVTNCNEKSRSLGFCATHYYRFRKHGDPNIVTRMSHLKGLTCSFDGCSDPMESKGFCNKHYVKFRRDFGTNKPCSVDGCSRMEYSKKLCVIHYNNLKRTGRIVLKEKCSAPNCNKKILTRVGRKFCRFHQTRHDFNLPLDSPVGATHRGALNWNWNGGVAEYKNHSTMKKIRKEIIKERGNKCDICGIVGKNIVVHHIDLTKTNHDKKNLRLLCQKCHINLHMKLKNK